VSRLARRRRRAAVLVLFGAIVGVTASAGVAAQETVTIGVPSFVSFSVTDLTTNTNGAPSPSAVSFSTPSLTIGKALRVSVMADAAAFTPPGGPGIPVAKVSWRVLGANGGTGANGTLSSSSYALVFQANAATASGHVDLAWSLAALSSGIRAGTHQLTIRWKVESITP
jgi:hypothetical protein